MRCNKSKASVCLFTNLLFPFQSVTLLFPSCPSFSCHLISLLAGVLRNSLPELLTPLNFPLCLSAAGCLSSRPTFLPPTVFFLERLKTRHSGRAIRNVKLCPPVSLRVTGIAFLFVPRPIADRAVSFLHGFCSARVILGSSAPINAPVSDTRLCNIAIL